VILFPIAFVWVICVVIWALRQTLEPTEGPWRPWRRRDRDPDSGPHGHPSRRGGPGSLARHDARELARRPARL